MNDGRRVTALNEYIAPDSASAGYRADKDWWKIYADRQLDDIVALALANNIDLAKSAVSVNRALYQANLLGADLVPGFSI